MKEFFPNTCASVSRGVSCAEVDAIMPRFWLAFGVVVALAAGARAEALDSDSIVVNVPKGDLQTVSERITLPEDVVMVKKGEGKLVLPNSAIDQKQLLRVRVTEGTLELSSDEEQNVLAAELSPSVKSKLALWLSAKDAEHLVSGKNGIQAWYDVRETDIVNPRFPYARTSELTAESGPVLKTGECASLNSVLTNKMDALYFGGLGSGISMHVHKPNGDAFTSLPVEMTAVHGVVDTWGYLFGTAQTDGSKTVMEADVGNRTLTSQTATGYGWRHCWGPVMGDAKIWVDGSEVDRADFVDVGFHLVHRRRNSISLVSNLKRYDQPQAIFSANARDDSEETKKTRGGDYVGEMMYFTNKLSCAERMEVQNYLTRKWFGKQRGTTEVSLSGGGNLLVDVPSGKEERNLDFAVRGEGAFVKKGEGALVYRPSAFLPGDPAAVKIEGGKVFALRDLPVVPVKGREIVAGREVHEFSVAGESLCVSTTSVSLATADAPDKIVKSGNSSVAIRSVPSGTARLEIESGTLSVRPEAAPLPRKYEVPVSNGSFEDWGEGTSGKASVYAREGWTPSGGAFFYDYVRWTAATTSEEYGSLGAAITAYNLHKVPPPSGNCALALKGHTASAYTIVEIPENGEYEFDFMMYSRLNYGANCRIAVLLRDEQGNGIQADFGEVNQVQTGAFERHSLRAMVEAGTYRLCLENRPYAGWVKAGSNLDMMLVVDDVRLHRIGEWKKEWKLPGGDFEGVTGCAGMQDGHIPVEMNAKYGIAGWTFHSEEYDRGSTTKTYPTVGVANPKMIAESGRFEGNAYNGKNRPLGGEYQLLFRRPASGNLATVSFTPPKGVWYLKCRAGLWADYDNPRLRASVTSSGGDSLEIGDISVIDEYGLNPYVWPVPFEADGETELTLSIAYVDAEKTGAAYQGVLVDDFSLVGEYSHELEIVRNGDFERPAALIGTTPGSRYGGWAYSHVIDGNGAQIGSNTYRIYGAEAETKFGGDHASGDIYAEISKVGILHQDVVIPAAGWYRFSGLFKGRIRKACTFGPLAVELVNMSMAETNRIGIVEDASSGTFEERSFLFFVPARGEYRLLFRGLARNESYCCMDDVSIRHVPQAASGTPSMPDNLRIDVFAGAGLRLDYPGLCTIKSFRSNGKRYRGIVDSSVCPEISGPGSLFVKGDGFVFVVK